MAEPMDERTLTALQGSIKKWEEIVAGTGVDGGVDNCPLCKEFSEATDSSAEGWRADGCHGCPVAIKADENGCGNTPYTKWANKFDWDEYPRRHKATTPALVALAQAELDFLRSLLPEVKS